MPRKQIAQSEHTPRMRSMATPSRHSSASDRSSSKSARAIALTTQTSPLPTMRYYSPFLQRALCPIAIALTALTTTSCSTKKIDTPTPSVRQIPETHPEHAAQTLSQLAPHIPDDFEWIFVSDYVSITQAVDHFSHYGFLRQQDITKTLSDLGTHYKLNPTSIRDYFNNGLNLQSGFALGYANGGFFAVMSVDERTLFRKWFDTLTKEEFGRPTYRTAPYDDRSYIAVDVLDREFACLFMDDDVAVITAKISSTEVSETTICDALDRIVVPTRAHIDANRIESFTTALAKSAMAIVAHPSSIASVVPGGEAISSSIGQYIDYATVGFNLEKASAQIHVAATWQNERVEGTPIGNAVVAIVPDTAPKLRLNQAPPPTARITANIDSAALETLALAFVDEKTRKRYDDIKSKLTQKLFKIDIVDQIIHNVGSISGIWFGNDIERPAIGISMRSPQKSDSFFAKLNILKRAISSDNVAITNEDGILHATMGNIHASYANGAIAIAFDDETYAAASQILRNDANHGAGTPNNSTPQIAASPSLIEGKILLSPWASSVSNGATPIFKAANITSTESADKLTISIELK